MNFMQIYGIKLMNLFFEPKKMLLVLRV